MFCNQCEQTAKGIGCEKIGVCGKGEDVAVLQDLLTHATQGLAIVAVAARKQGIGDNDVDRFICEATFACLTNVDFDPARFDQWIRKTVQLRDELKAKVAAAGGTVDSDAAALSFVPAPDLDGLKAQGEKLDFINSLDDNEDLRSLKQIALYGLRGLAAYTDHAAILGQTDDEVFAAINELLGVLTRKDLGVDDLVAGALKIGEVNIRAMELLDAGNTTTYGHPVPTPVPLGAKAGKAILVTGHDLKDLQLLLEQTRGKGINIYTHGEMLPCHGYPELKKYDHCYGHYGTAWQNQQKEMEVFPGAILFTTNCIQKPRDSYKDNVFTTGLVGWPGISHIGDDKDLRRSSKRRWQCPVLAKIKAASRSWSDLDAIR